MKRQSWTTLILLILLLATVVDLFISPWFLIVNLVVLGLFVLVSARLRK
jgi:hypothetical protein